MSATSIKLKMPVLILLAGLTGGLMIVAGPRAVDSLRPLIERNEELYVPLSDAEFAALLDRIHNGYYERTDAKFENLLKRIHAGEFDFHDPRPNRK